MVPLKPGPPRKPAAELPKLEKFDPSLVDKSKDACVDFYQYTCSKWIAAHPITPDMPISATDVPLFLYNQTILRNTLDAGRGRQTGHRQRAPDRRLSGRVAWTKPVRNANGKTWLQPSLNTIASLKSDARICRECWPIST